MSELGILRTAADGMDAQRFALDVAARNVAAAQVSDPSHPFARLVPQFVTGLGRGGAEGTDGIAGTDGADATGGEYGDADVADAADVPDADDADLGDAAGDDAAFGEETGAIRVAGTRTERGTDVDAVTEMVAVLNAQRAYEANASVFDAGKRLAERTIDMGRL